MTDVTAFKFIPKKDSEDSILGEIVSSVSTKLKISAKDSSELNEDDVILIPKDTKLPVLSYAVAKDGHQEVCFAGFLGSQAKSNWFVYRNDWILLEEMHELPKDKDPKSTPVAPDAIVEDPKTYVTVPVYGKVALEDPLPGCTHLTWHEALHGGNRIPTAGNIVGGETPESVTRNLVKIGQALQKIRDNYGRPITVNSWYRDPKTNRAVGGARYSRHQNGDAVDFNIKGIHPHDVYKNLNRDWVGGLASSNVFVHMDTRGYKSRWKYPF